MSGKSKKIGLNRKSFAAICALSLAGSVIYELPYIKYVYYDSLNAAFGMTEQQSGFLLSMYAIGCILTYIPGGIFADRFSTKKLMVASLFGTGLLGIALALFMNYTAALIIFFLFAISTSFVFWSGLMKALRIVGGKEDSGSAYGWYYALSSVVALICSFIFLYFYNKYLPDHHAAMFAVIMAMSIAAIIAGVLIIFLYKDSDDPAANTAEEDKFHFRDLPVALKNKYVWLSAILMFLMYAVYSCASYFTPYLTARIGMDVQDSALIAVIRTYVLFFLSPVGGYIADKLLKSTLKFYSIGFVFLAALYFGVIFVPGDPSSMTLAITLSFLASAFGIMMYGVMWSILNEVNIPLTYAGTAIGIASIFVYTPDLFMHTIFGSWLDKYGAEGGYLRIFVTLGSFAVLAIFMSLYLAKAAKKTAAAKAEEAPAQTEA